MHTNNIISRFRSWTATIAVCIAIVFGTMSVKLWPRTAPLSECSEVYRKYAGRNDIDASFIKDFRINDTLSVDVTLLKAKDSNSWVSLLTDFEIPTPPSSFMQRINNGEDVIFVKYIMDEDTTLGLSSTPKTKSMIAPSRIHRTLTIFDITEKTQTKAILQYNFPYKSKK